MNLKQYIKDVPDFPDKGILFRDIQPLLADPQAFKHTIEQLAKTVGDADLIVAPDARGFIFGCPVAMITGKPFVMVRKPGKLPGKTTSKEYKLEYGTNTLEIADNIIRPGKKIVIIDDLLAIGGTTKAIIDLVEKQGGKVVRASYVIELDDLNGRDKLGEIEVNSLLNY